MKASPKNPAGHQRVATAAASPSTYETVRSYLNTALDRFLAAGQSGYELVEFAVDKFGHAIVPYLTRFQEEIREGRVHVEKLGDAARTAVFGVQVTDAQREQMIREAAFFRAEQRGFSGGDPNEDWSAAEREIDALLERQAGVVGRARKALSSAVSIADDELAQVRTTVESWISARQPPRGKSN